MYNVKIHEITTHSGFLCEVEHRSLVVTLTIDEWLNNTPVDDTLGAYTSSNAHYIDYVSFTSRLWSAIFRILVSCQDALIVDLHDLDQQIQSISKLPTSQSIRGRVMPKSLCSEQSEFYHLKSLFEEESKWQQHLVHACGIKGTLDLRRAHHNLMGGELISGIETLAVMMCTLP